jgi:hypothetical protein
MDLSKLPRFSQTKPGEGPTPFPPDPRPLEAQQELPQEPSPEPDKPEPQRPGPTVLYVSPPAIDPASVWISIAVGAILLLFSPRLLIYFFAIERFAATYSFSDVNGPLHYTQTVFFWGDVCLVIFAVMLIVDGLAMMATRSRYTLMVALLFTVLTTLANLVYAIWMLQKGYGVQLLAVLAVAFGGYVAIQQWQMLRNFHTVLTPSPRA